jgi:Retrotransposon gag protein
MTANDEDNRLLKDFTAHWAGEINMGHIVPVVEVNDFELKPTLINMVSQNQFVSLAHEDLNQHLANFEEFYNTLKMNEVTPDVNKLRLFPFSLRDRAKGWLRSLTPTTVSTWAQILAVFLSKYFPPSKIVALRNKITNFRHKEGESFSDAWDRYQELLRMCPHQDFVKWRLLQTFYEGLTNNTGMTIDVTTVGSLMNRRIGDAYNLIEEMVLNQVQWSTERGNTRAQMSGKFETDQITKQQAMVEALQTKNRQIKTETHQNMRLESANVSSIDQLFLCVSCGCTDHLTLTALLSNSNIEVLKRPLCWTIISGRKIILLEHLHPGWRNQPNFSWRSDQGQLNQNQSRSNQGFGLR